MLYAFTSNTSRGTSRGDIHFEFCFCLNIISLNLLYINYIQIVERICGITYLFIGFNSADRYWFNRLSVPYTCLDGINTWNICYRQTDTISDRKTHAPIEIEAHRNVEVTMSCNKGLSIYSAIGSTFWEGNWIY